MSAPTSNLRLIAGLLLGMSSFAFGREGRAQSTPPQESAVAEAEEPPAGGDSIPPTVPTPEVDPAKASPTPSLEQAKPDKKKKKKSKGDFRPNVFSDEERFGRLEIGGRVFTQAQYVRREAGATHQESFDLSVSRAQIDVDWESPNKWLSAQIEFQVHKPRLRDAYIEVKGGGFFARMGQFKPPVSIIQMESSTKTLPVARRGFISDLLSDYLDVAGRRPGFMVGWRGKGGIKPTVRLGAFQGSQLHNGNTDPGDRDVDLIELKDLKSQGFAGRFDVDLGSVELGAYYQHRIGSPGKPTFRDTKHYPTGGLDLVFDHAFEFGGVRAWGDAMVGKSWYEFQGKAPDDKDATFLSGRLIGAFRLGGTQTDALYVEPFGMIGMLDPDTEVDRDWAMEYVLGVSAGLWRRARITLQGEMNQGDTNFPNQTNGYLYGLSPDMIGVTLRAGVIF